MNDERISKYELLQYGGFSKLGVHFGGPHNKDNNILGSILGSPYSGKLPYGSYYLNSEHSP